MAIRYELLKQRTLGSFSQQQSKVGKVNTEQKTQSSQSHLLNELRAVSEVCVGFGQIRIANIW